VRFLYSLIFEVHATIINVATTLTNDSPRLLGCDFGNLDFAFVVLDGDLQSILFVLLGHKLDGVRHVLHLCLQSAVLSTLLVLLHDLLVSLSNSLLCLGLLSLHDLHVRVGLLLVADGISQLLLKAVQSLHCLSGVKLQRKQLLVALFDILHMLLVLNLQLMEIDELQVVTHLLLVSDLGLSLKNLLLERYILELQLVDKCLLCLELVVHVLQQFLSIVLSSPTVFSCRKETAEIKRFLSNLGDGQVCAFKNGLKSFQEKLRLLSALFDIVFQGLKLLVSDLILVFSCQL